MLHAEFRVRKRWVFAGMALIAIGLGGYLMITWSNRYAQMVREQEKDAICVARLQQLAVAVENYQHDHGCLPPAYIPDSDGKPMHSWRILLLRYIEPDPSIYEQYDFSEPWNGPKNSALAEAHPEVAEHFRCPYDVDNPGDWTSYVAIVGPETLWPGAEPKRMSKEEFVTNSMRLLLTEVRESRIHWMEPRDLTYNEAMKVLVASSPHSGFAHFVTPNRMWGRIGENSKIIIDGEQPLLTDETDEKLLIADQVRIWESPAGMAEEAEQGEG